MNSRLIVGNTMAKFSMFWYTTKTYMNVNSYIGLQDIDVEGNFVWENGEPLSDEQFQYIWLLKNLIMTLAIKTAQLFSMQCTQKNSESTMINAIGKTIMYANVASNVNLQDPHTVSTQIHPTFRTVHVAASLVGEITNVPSLHMEEASDFADAHIDEISDFADTHIDEISDFADTHIDEIGDFADTHMNEISDFADHHMDEISDFADPHIDEISDFADAHIDEISDFADAHIDESLTTQLWFSNLHASIKRFTTDFIIRVTKARNKR
ncbi:hypothetical protein RRG08_053004 [Elysia crispata]|uniref:Uncharacterized protein n=1 Tax=Elysia crispata TaxID=231223 RepID=A0AAE0ZMJ1_9GAST|nr:hypothetical protein RRG08_053004 [Elysia crispata]